MQFVGVTDDWFSFIDLSFCLSKPLNEIIHLTNQLTTANMQCILISRYQSEQLHTASKSSTVTQIVTSAWLKCSIHYSRKTQVKRFLSPSCSECASTVSTALLSSTELGQGGGAVWSDHPNMYYCSDSCIFFSLHSSNNT